jgi:selenocysteine-specific elongation factor
MRVIGTAGHVDHGKSTLVQALTGTHPDRLKEEREREMTIDLGFAWLTLPDGEEVGIVDVPGHRDFIENMLSGVGGIDAALFVIAADEGVMPQTREHLAILDLLQIPGGVVALTKIDMVEEIEWIDLVEEEVRETLRNTVLEGVAIVRVSGKTGAGIEELTSALEACLAEQPPRPDLGRPRLPVDRVFTIAGFGTVVTGTLTDGSLSVGDEVDVLPAGLRGRVRGLQTHKQKENRAVPGSRTAANISGIRLDQVQRGDVIAHPGDYKPTGRIDVQFRLLPDADLPVRHNMDVKLFIGAAEVMARLRLLGVEELLPGQDGWLQLEMKQPVVALRGDRYILRRPSPGETLGGGAVVDPHPRRRYKRFSKETLSRLEKLTEGTPGDVLLQAFNLPIPIVVKDAVLRSSLDTGAAQTALDELVNQGHLIILDGDQTQVHPLSDRLAISVTSWAKLKADLLRELTTYHRKHPLRRGMPREELKSRIKLAARAFNASLSLLSAQGLLVEQDSLVRQPEHEIRLSSGQRKLVDGLLERFEAQPYSPPSVKECLAETGEDLYQALLDLGELVQVSSDVVFSSQAYQQMVQGVKQMIRENETITAAEVRDHFSTSRKYVLALLEYLDGSGVTIRDGDVRRLR